MSSKLTFARNLPVIVRQSQTAASGQIPASSLKHTVVAGVPPLRLDIPGPLGLREVVYSRSRSDT